MNSIDSRIEALFKTIERNKMEQEAPIDELSKSLYELERELTGLDHLGKVALLEELNGDGLWLDMPELERMIREVTA